MIETPIETELPWYLLQEVNPIEIINLRDFSNNEYKQIDDEPYGGGSGMIMMCEPLFKAIEHCIDKSPYKPKVIFPSPKGKILNHPVSESLSKEN